MSDRRNARVVYSTGAGRVCPRCGWPVRDCRCSAGRTVDEAVPPRVVAKLRIEKSGRGGKTVTVIDGLPRNAAFLKELAHELKHTCGTGGAVLDAAIELQGDMRDRARDLLTRRNFIVKG